MNSKLFPVLFFLCSILLRGQNLVISLNHYPDYTQDNFFDLTADFMLTDAEQGEIYYDISFPAGVRSVEVLQTEGWGTQRASIRKPGDTIYHKNGTRIPAKYILASFYRQAGSSLNLRLRLRVFPDASGIIPIYYRATFLKGAENFSKPSAGEGDTTDQQGWPVYMVMHSHLNYQSERTISFAGLKWDIKAGYNIGPGGNNFSNNTESVWVDDAGLHLKIKKYAGVWYCAEVISRMKAANGIQRFYIEGRIDSLDRNVVFAPFLYFDNEHEIDIEFSRWGAASPAAMNGHYSVKPDGPPEKMKRFNFGLNGTHTTHSIEWKGKSVLFKSSYGHYSELPDSTYLINSFAYTGAGVPSESDGLTIHINLWLMDGQAPTDGKESEIIIKNGDFSVF